METYVLNWTDGLRCWHKVVTGYNAAVRLYNELIEDHPEYDVAFPIRGMVD